MARRSLTRSEREPVVILAQTTGAANDLGERVTGWQPGQQVQALVQAISLEEAQRAGLTGSRERLTVFLPPLRLDLPARLRLRGRDWQVLAAEHRTSRTVTTVEAL